MNIKVLMLSSLLVATLSHSAMAQENTPPKNNPAVQATQNNPSTSNSTDAASVNSDQGGPDTAIGDDDY